MVYCANCGAEVPGKFCPNCGAAVAAPGAAPSSGTSGYAPPAGGYTPPSGGYAPPVGGPPPMGAATSGMSEPLANALCYTPFGIGLICDIVFLVAAPYNQNRNIRFHAFQGLFLNIAIVVAWIALAFVGGILALMTHGLLFGLFPLFWLAILVLFIFMMVKSYSGQRVKLPLIGDFAEKQA